MAMTKPVAVIGSPNTTSKFAVDVLEGSITQPLEGKLLYFDHEEGDHHKLVLTQMAMIKGRNRWHEDSILKAVIKRQGALEHLSGDTDTKEASLKLLGVFERAAVGDGYDRSSLNTPPRSGTSVYEIDAPLLNRLVGREAGIFYLGYIRGSQTPAPFHLRHFGPIKDGGFGEAHMMAVFGKSGSGKSIIAAQLLGGFARHPKMGILVVDPVGEYHDDTMAAGSDLDFKFHTLLKSTRGEFTLYDLSRVALAGRWTFVRLLHRAGFFAKLGFGPAKQEDASRALFEQYDEDQVQPREADVDNAIQTLVAAAPGIYMGRGAASKQQEIQDKARQYRNSIHRIWDQVHRLFQTENRIPIDDVINAVLKDRKVVILDVQRITQEFEDISPYHLKYIILHDIFHRMLYQVHRGFREGETTNALICLDEAHEYVPQDPGDDEDRIALLAEIIRATKTTRKFGIGWMFVTQSIADFHKEVYRQVHDYIFGWGLGVGADEGHVIEIVGDEMFDLYRSLPNPKQSGIYSLMIAGGIVAVGTTGSPVVITGFPSMGPLLNSNGLKPS